MDALRRHLRKEGFVVWEASDGDAALEIAKRELPGLIIMDLAVTPLSGGDLYQQLKSDPRTEKSFVLILSARSTEADKVAALEMGVDDYVTRPFSPREVALRTKAILRYQTQKALAMSRVKVGEIELDRSRSEVKVAGKWVALTPVEYKLLDQLSMHRGCVQTRRGLLKLLWEPDSGNDTRTVDTHIGRLRRKLGEAADQIVTIRGFGYRLDEEAEIEVEADELAGV
jgi:DNA-binding response OmpR family regulator